MKTIGARDLNAVHGGRQDSRGRARPDNNPVSYGVNLEAQITDR